MQLSQLSMYSRPSISHYYALLLAIKGTRKSFHWKVLMNLYDKFFIFTENRFNTVLEISKPISNIE